MTCKRALSCSSSRTLWMIAAQTSSVVGSARKVAFHWTPVAALTSRSRASPGCPQVRRLARAASQSLYKDIEENVPESFREAKENVGRAKPAFLWGGYIPHRREAHDNVGCGACEEQVSRYPQRRIEGAGGGLLRMNGSFCRLRNLKI